MSGDALQISGLELHFTIQQELDLTDHSVLFFLMPKFMFQWFVSLIEIITVTIH